MNERENILEIYCKSQRKEGKLILRHFELLMKKESSHKTFITFLQLFIFTFSKKSVLKQHSAISFAFRGNSVSTSHFAFSVKLTLKAVTTCATGKFQFGVEMAHKAIVLILISL